MTDAPLAYADVDLKRILKSMRTIAMVGASPNPMRPSHFVFIYLKNKGYEVIPINPGHAGESILGQTVYADLHDVPRPIDMVDVFRASKDVPPIVDAAIAIGAKVVWMQLGVRHDRAAETARTAGLEVVMNRCPKIEYGRLFGEIGWLGVDRRVLSSKRGAAMQLKTRKGRLT